MYRRHHARSKRRQLFTSIHGATSTKRIVYIHVLLAVTMSHQRCVSEFSPGDRLSPSRDPKASRPPRNFEFLMGVRNSDASILHPEKQRCFIFSVHHPSNRFQNMFFFICARPTHCLRKHSGVEKVFQGP
jgi:hypothetical protein